MGLRAWPDWQQLIYRAGDRFARRLVGLVAKICMLCWRSRWDSVGSQHSRSNTRFHSTGDNGKRDNKTLNCLYEEETEL